MYSVGLLFYYVQIRYWQEVYFHCKTSYPNSNTIHSIIVVVTCITTLKK